MLPVLAFPISIHTPQRKSKLKTLEATESKSKSRFCINILEALQFINTSEENENKIYQGLSFSGGGNGGEDSTVFLKRPLHVADIKETQG